MDINNLKSFPEFNFTVPSGATWEKIVNYMVYVYDPNSELLKLYRDDLYRRKREGALKAGLKIGKDGRFMPEIEAIIVGENDEFNMALVRFARSVGIADYPSYLAYGEIFFKEVEASQKEKDPGKRKTILQNLKESGDKLASLERKIFTGDEVLNVRNALYQTAEMQRLGIRPEEIAKQIQEGKVEL